MDIEEELFENINIRFLGGGGGLITISFCNILVWTALVALVSVMSDIPNDTDVVVCTLLR